MTTAIPADASLKEVVDLEMSAGEFPPTGAVLTFMVAQPVPADRAPFIARWDQQNLAWVPLASATSPDRTIVSAKLEHFSTYGFFDILSNGIGKLIGVRTARPDCPADPPGWDDKSAPQFYDDLNGPVLWCATTDPAHPDDLEIKLKLNRGAAASITTAIKPVWSHSDLWQDFTPATWLTMGLSGPESLIPNPDAYFIQPTGEFDFRFSKSDVLTYWHANRTKPLIEVDTSVPDVLAGLLFNVAGNLPGGSALFLTTTSMAISQCSSALVAAGRDLTLTTSSATAVLSKSFVLMGVLASCMADQKEFITQAAARYSATQNAATDFKKIAEDAGLAAKKVMVVAQIYAAVQALAPVADAATDLLLDPVARQFVFQPSDAALKEFVGRALDLGSVMAPAMCDRPSGQLVNGALPIPKPPGGSDPGFTDLLWNRDGYIRAEGNASTGTQGLTALVFGCSKGGISWPNVIGVYGPGPGVYGSSLQLITSLNLGDLDHKEHSVVEAISFEDHALRVDWRTNEDGGVGGLPCEPVHETGLFSTEPVPGVVPSMSLRPVDVHVVRDDGCR